MKIIIGVPPNFEAISARFRVAGKPILYAYGDTIYNPANIDIPEHLLWHEKMHGNRQQGRVEEWWEQYLTDNEFLVREEVVAHVAEYRYLIQHNSNRHARRGYLRQTAKRLASPLYGKLLTTNKALALLKEIV